MLETSTDESTQAAQRRSAWSPSLQIVWAYRRIIVTSAAISTCGVLVLCLAYFSQPRHHFVSLDFTLLFDGVDQGKYPSGIPFSPDDIITRAIIKQVYHANRLDQYGSLDDFHRSLFIKLRPSPELAALNAQYRSNLTARKLTAIDRGTIENEYTEKKSAMIQSGSHVLNMDLSQDISAAMPSSLQGKVLDDILRMWADDAAERKGALQYQISILTKNILPKETLKRDYFIAFDILRQKTAQIVGNIDEISRLPGAGSFRTAKDSVSLSEISLSLSDLLRFGLVPSMHMVRSYGLSTDPKIAGMYIKAMIYNIERKKKKAAGRAKALEQSLAAYVLKKPRTSTGAVVLNKDSRQPAQGPTMLSAGMPAVIPQFGENFFEQLINMTSQKDDLLFRQQFTKRITEEALKEVQYDYELGLYKDMLDVMVAVQHGAVASPGDTEDPNKIRVLAISVEDRVEVTKEIEHQLKSTYDELIVRLSQIEAIYNALSIRNLNPRAFMYSAIEPVYTTTQRAISAIRMIMYSLIMIFGITFLVTIGCSLHDSLRSAKAA